LVVDLEKEINKRANIDKIIELNLSSIVGKEASNVELLISTSLCLSVVDHIYNSVIMNKDTLKCKSTIIYLYC
jgi:hypothetical protein